MTGRAHGRAGSSTAVDGVAVVVVNYESGAVLEQTLCDLAAETPTELVVVDNGSTDGSVDRAARHVADLPGFAVITAGTNLGYGAAVNRGVAATSAPYVLVCNPDLRVHEGTTSRLVRSLADHPSWAMAGPLIRTAAGDRYPSARQFPSLPDAAGHALLGMVAPRNRFTCAYQQSRLDDPDTSDTTVDWVSGACFLARRSAFEQVGGFDESYFMYVEDVDLCWRLRLAGWQVGYVPGGEVTHAQGVSTDSHPYKMILEHHRSLLRFAVRSSNGRRALLLPVIALGIGVRAAMACLVRSSGR